MKRTLSPMTVAVTGATGYVGRFVVAELQRMGVHVRALARPNSSKEGFATSIDWVEGDLRSASSLNTLVNDATAVVHLAYEHVPGRYRGGEGDDLGAWVDANVLGSLNLLRVAQQAAVSRFVFLSSRAVFSRTEPGRVLDETHPVSPDSHYGAYKVAVEAFLRSFSNPQDMQTFAVRATGVYGVMWPIEQSKWWTLVTNALKGKEYNPAGGGTEVHGGDIARAVWALVSQPQIESDVFHMSDLYVSHGDVVRIAKRFAKQPGELSTSSASSASSPTNPLECRNLSELGIQLGGVARLEETIEQLVHAIQRR
jgi:nucleoside-diphosphate-sugar epimerase